MNNLFEEIKKEIFIEKSILYKNQKCLQFLLFNFFS